MIFKSQCQLEEKLSYQKNSKALFKYINGRKKSSEKIDSIANENYKAAEDPFQISNLFNKYFHSIYTNSKVNFEAKHHLPNIDCKQNLFTKNCIKNCFKYIKNKRYVGPNNIPTYFYIKTFDILSDIYVKLFNSFYDDYFIPSDWKIYLIIPLYKRKGSRLFIQNYRLITKSDALSRIFKSAIKVKLSEILQTKLSLNQHGFI